MVTGGGAGTPTGSRPRRTGLWIGLGAGALVLVLVCGAAVTVGAVLLHRSDDRDRRINAAPDHRRPADGCTTLSRSRLLTAGLTVSGTRQDTDASSSVDTFRCTADVTYARTSPPQQGVVRIWGLIFAPIEDYRSARQQAADDFAGDRQRVTDDRPAPGGPGDESYLQVKLSQSAAGSRSTAWQLTTRDRDLVLEVAVVLYSDAGAQRPEDDTIVPIAQDLTRDAIRATS